MHIHILSANNSYPEPLTRIHVTRFIFRAHFFALLVFYHNLGYFNND